MKKRVLLLFTCALLFSGVGIAQTGKDRPKAKAKDSTAVKKPMPNCPGKVCAKGKGN